MVMSPVGVDRQPQGRVATIVVSASDSRFWWTCTPGYHCNGTADDVEIQAALDEINTSGVGGRVVLLEGTYNLTADLTIYANTALEGQGFATILNFDDSGGGTVTDAGAIAIVGDNVSVKNLKAQLAAGCGTATARPNLVFIDSRSNITLEILWLYGDITVADDGSNYRQNAIYLRLSSEIKVINCRLENNNRHGLYSHGCNRCGITDCDITANTYGGAHLYATEACIIKGNSIYNNTTMGLELGTGSNENTVIGNTIQSNSTHGIFCANNYRNAFTGNIIEDNTYHGIYLIYADNAAITGNTVANNGGTDYNGIYLWGCDEGVISGNACVANGLHGIYLYQSSYCTITGNGCNDQDTGDGINITGTASGNADYNMVTGNTCHGNGDDGIEIAGGTDANGNSIIANEVRGNSGTAIVDAGTLTIIKDNEGIVGFGDDKATTLTIAASNSKQPANADYVCNGTDDDVQILAAFDTLSPNGGRIILLDGTFNCATDLNVNAHETFEGQGWNTIINFYGTAIEHGIRIVGDNVQIKNLKAQLAAGAGTAGDRPNLVYVNNRTKILLENLWLYGDITVNDDSNYRQNGIFLRLSDEIKVINCRVENDRRRGIYLHGCNQCNIFDNTITANSYGGIFLYASNTASIVEGNNIFSNTTQGIEIGSASNDNIIIGNTIRDNSTHGIHITASYRNTITGNIVEGNSGWGIGLYVNADNTTVTGNTVTSNGGSTYSGIYLWSSDECTITGNTCRANRLHGIHLYQSSYCTISGNGCYDQSVGDGINVTGTGSENADYNTLTGNACHSNGDDGIAIEGTTDANYNIVVANQLHGNSGTNLVDNGTNTQLGHNVTV